MLSKEFEFTLNLAFKEARNKRYEFMTVEYLLLALLDNAKVINILQYFNIDLDNLRQELQVFIDNTTPLIDENNPDVDTQPTLGFQRVLQRAVFHVQSSGRLEVNGIHVLAAIFSEQESQAVQLLKKYKISRLDIINYLARENKKEDYNDLPEKLQTLIENNLNELDKENLQQDDNSESNFNRNVLNTYTVNLNEQAVLDKIDPLIGREKELHRIIQVLCRRKKNNPLLLGEAGVGKTALIEGLAKLIVDKKVPDKLADVTIYSLDLGALVAGTKYRGDFEKRFKSFLKQLKQNKKAILFIDEIHTLIGAGAASGGIMDAANIVKPLLSSGDIKCIGSTTYKEYNNIFLKEQALSRRFQKIDISENSIEETYQILKGLKSNLEKHHGVKYTDRALQIAAELGDKYLHDRFLPDKAIDIIDEAGANQQLLAQNKRKKVIGTNEVQETIAKIANIPSSIINKSERELLKNLEKNLQLKIFGQDEAITNIGSSIYMSRSGLSNHERPVCSFLFAGPTGVGKTELTKQLADNLGLELIRFDMSEYMERHAVARLIGAPPGYVGFDQGGLLTDTVMKHPHAVLLLDEIEKAHPDVFNLLLQIMDYGILTDNNGRKADFRHIILIMTTNAGAGEYFKKAIGFKKNSNINSDAQLIIDKIFPPEFRNRLDSIVQFNALNEEVILNIVDKFLKQLQTSLAKNKIQLEVSPKAKSLLADRGYSSILGARPMERLIREKLYQPLSKELLFGDLQKTSKVMVDVKNDDISINFESLQLAPET